MSKALGDLLDGLPAELGALPVRRLVLDSRAVQAGDTFLAYPGSQADGRDYIADALARGAALVLAEAPCRVATGSVPLVEVHNLRAQAGLLGSRFHGEPSAELTVIGVTGTNGKTTVAWLLADVAERCGLACGYAGTLGAGRVPALATAGNMTTADPLSLQAQLAAMRDQGCRYAALEVSSHALAQDRVAGVDFDIAVFTNLSRDHLDYHGDMNAYGRAKARLIEWPDLLAAVINIDDPFGAALAARATAPTVTTAIAGEAAVSGREIATMSRGADVGTGFDLHSPWGARKVFVPLIGDFNVSNVLAVIAVLCVLEVDLDAVIAALAQAHAPPGRMQPFSSPGRPLVVVDYAHTPDALKRALEVLAGFAHRPLVCVFGCGGDRDRGKRPQMGAIAERWADHVVLTDDNPRGEPPEAIISDIRSGMHAPQRAAVCHAREAAIEMAIDMAGKSGSVLVAGKGHEQTQMYADRRVSHSDLDVVQRLMRSAA